MAFDVSDIDSFPGPWRTILATVQLFHVGTKRDMSSPAQYSQTERDAPKYRGPRRGGRGGVGKRQRVFLPGRFIGVREG